MHHPILRAIACSLLCLGAAAAEGIRFPDDAGVVDVTKAPYSARPDGASDCTEAIQRALIDYAGRGIIYLPDGVYVVSETLRWTGRETRNILQGQSREHTIIRLRDRCPGFVDPTQPRPVIITGWFPPQRFRNAIRDLTVDIGSGNHGAIGVRFNASNQGQMNTVTIRSGDGDGLIGLDMGYTGDVGPLTIKRLRVEGFAVGISTAHGTAGQTLEHVELEGQRVVGWLNDGQRVAARDLRSVNAVPAIWNKRGSGLITLLDADCRGRDGAAAGPAIINEAGLFADNLRSDGYRLAVDGSRGTGADATGPLVEEFSSHGTLRQFPSPPRRLRLPVEETPDVPWDDPATWVPVTRFPPKQVTVATTGKKPGEKTVTDWTESLQQAIDSGAGTVYFPKPESEEAYSLLGTVHLRGKLHRLIGLERGIARGSHPVLVLDDGEAPTVVVERFDLLYTGTVFRTASRRNLMLGALCGYLDAGPDARVFAEDVILCMRMAAGAKVWMRGWNSEYTSEDNKEILWGERMPIEKHPGNLNDGGDLWVLGFKTEGDGTLLTTRHGGRSEVMGGVVYANKDSYAGKRAFVVEDSSLALSIGESTIRNQPFNMVEESRAGVTRLFTPALADAYGAGAGGQFVLFSAWDGPGNEPPLPPPAPAADPAPGTGTGLSASYCTGEFAEAKASRVETPACDWGKQAPVPGDGPWSVRWSGQLEARVTGLHAFSFDSPRTRLVIDDQVVIDTWRSSPRHCNGAIRLQAGKRYPVSVEYRSEEAKGGKLTLTWREPGRKTEPLPASQLFPLAGPRPQVRLGASGTTLAEGGKPLGLRLERHGPDSTALAVALAPACDLRTPMVLRFAARGSAIAGEDYAPLPDAITIPVGQQAVALDLVPLDDRRPEPPKELRLELAPSTRYDVIGGPLVIAVTDDDLPAPGTGTGLSAEFFSGNDFTGNRTAQLAPRLDYAWDKAVPAKGLDPKAGWSARWTGAIEPRFSETYRLTFQVSEYALLQVWLDGRLILPIAATVSDDGKAKRTGVSGNGLTSVQLPLEKGRLYDLKVEYVSKNLYGQLLRFLWSSPSQFEEPVPASQLHPEPVRQDGK